MDPCAITEMGKQEIRTARAVWRHALAEKDSDLELVMSTIARDTTVTYALPTERPDGSLGMMVGTDLSFAAAHYADLYAMQSLRDWEPFREIRRSWYVFFDGIFTYTPAGSTTDREGHSIVLFPVVEAEDGIQGELPWSRVPSSAAFRAAPGTDARAPGSLPLRDRDALLLYRKYLDALRRGDPAGAAAFLIDSPQCAIRDYTQSGGPTFIALDGRQPFLDHMTAFFERYAVVTIEPLTTIASHWYVFCELHWVIRERGAPGRTLIMHTAEFHPIDESGRMTGRVGYGTAPVVA